MEEAVAIPVTVWVTDLVTTVLELLITEPASPAMIEKSKRMESSLNRRMNSVHIWEANGPLLHLDEEWFFNRV